MSLTLKSLLGVGVITISAAISRGEGSPSRPTPADQPSPRTDHNSELAHLALVQKAVKGDVDIYFEGDSITRRWDAAEPEYRNLRENWEKNFSGWKVGDFAWGGDKTQNILWRLDHGELDGVNPKIFVLLAGTNNVSEVPSGEAVAQEVEGVVSATKAILARFKAKAPGATIVLTAIFPRGDQAEGPKMEAITAINTRLAQMADGKLVRYLNLNQQLADASGKPLPGMLNPDQLHPTVKTYQIWADQLKPIFTELLGPGAKG